jgi:hypothetical protein
MDAVEPLQKKAGLRSRIKEVIKLSSSTEQIAGYQSKIQKLRLNFMVLKIFPQWHNVLTRTLS